MVAPKIKLIPFHCSHFVRPCRLAAQLSYSFHPNSLSHNIPDVETLIISPTHYTYSSSHCFKSVCCLPLRPCIKFCFSPFQSQSAQCDLAVLVTQSYPLHPRGHLLCGPYLGCAAPFWALIPQPRVYFSSEVLIQGYVFNQIFLSQQNFFGVPPPPPPLPAIESSSLSLSTYRWQAQCDLAALLPRYICYINSERNWWNIHLWVSSL